MSEQEYFEKLDELTIRRNSLITSHFGSAFLQEYMDAGERIWYSKNVGFVDEQIVKLANEISKALKIGKTYKKVAEVYKDEYISRWYNNLKMQKNKNKYKDSANF